MTRQNEKDKAAKETPDDQARRNNDSVNDPGDYGDPGSRLHEDVRVSSVNVQSKPLSIPIQTLCCPACEQTFEKNCEGLEIDIECPHCDSRFPYVDGYLNYFKAYIEVFIDRIHPLPLVPGFSTGGRVIASPDELLLIDYGITYSREPGVFFLLPGGKAAREQILGNQLIIPLSVSSSNFVLFTRALDPLATSKPVEVSWMAIGEVGDWEKPLWLNYLQSGADLVQKQEDVAAVVMLLIALDFFYDRILHRIGIGYDIIRREGRRPGMNEKRAKLKLIEENIGMWHSSFAENLRELTDYRNRIVHTVVKHPSSKTFTGRRAFQIVMRAVMFLIELHYRANSGK